MAATYTENPANFSEVSAFVITETKEIKRIFFSAEKIFFYDACSFQRHSNLGSNEKNILIAYYKERGIVLFITRCILMELASDRHRLSDDYIDFFRELNSGGIKIVVYNEEYTYDILSECFSTNEKVNEYLMWSVRLVKSPVGTVEETLKNNGKLFSEIIQGKNLKQSELYRNFFTAVRANKEHHDNLGEELIAICVNILSYLPGLNDGKLCFLTDDKGAVRKFNAVMNKSDKVYRGSQIILFSTPKLVQHMFREKTAISGEEMEKLISQGTSGNIAVMGITPFDLKVKEKITMSSRELVQKIMEPNGIQIVL